VIGRHRIEHLLEVAPGVGEIDGPHGLLQHVQVHVHVGVYIRHLFIRNLALPIRVASGG
jgi:hypothetical protein